MTSAVTMDTHEAVLRPRRIVPETPEPNALLARVFARMPDSEIRAFSPEQIASLNAAFLNADRGYHAIDYRTSVSLFGMPFYVTFLMGREQRSKERLAAEGQTTVTRVAIAHILLLTVFLVCTAAALVCALYLAKSALGIDLFPGPSLLHGVFYDDF